MENTFRSRMSMGAFQSPARKPPTSLAMAGRKSLNVGLKKPAVPSSRYSISNRSTQSNMCIARSANNVVNTFGSQLPIVVSEALMFTDSKTDVSINCSDNGWGWAISGRKLFVWQYKDAKEPKVDNFRTPQRRTVISQCRELTLPHCDIGHKASLITVLTTDGQQMASCLAVSPTGDVRFWPSIAHDALSVDEMGLLEGQEFDQLIKISGDGYVLATTTCNLVLLQLQMTNGRHAIVHRVVRPPTGFLGGIGKRFASILTGSNANDRENRFLKVCAERTRSSDCCVSILSDRFIQRWSVDANYSESFQFEDQHIIQKIRQTFHNQVWPTHDMDKVETFMLDMQAQSGADLTLLVAATNLAHAPQIYYALITIGEHQSSFTIKNFVQMKATGFYAGSENDDCLKYRFILSRSTAYVYGGRCIYEVIMGDIVQPGVENTEKIEFPTQTDKVLAATVYNQTAIFFSRMNGFVSVTMTDVDNTDCMNNSMVSEAPDYHVASQTFHNDTVTNLTVYDIDPDDLQKLQDSISQIKAAFIYHLKQMPAKCSGIINQLLSDRSSFVSTDFDNLIVKIAKDLAEDTPAADPRWEDVSNKKYALGSSTSMQIIQQLREKNRAFGHFIEFLQATGLWQNLGSVSEKSQIRATCNVLSDINEKITAAITLKSIHNTFSQIIDEAIDISLKKRNEQLPNDLTPQDIFYVQVTRFQDFFKSLVYIIDETVHQEQSSTKASQFVLDISKIYLMIFHEIYKFRESKSSVYKLSADKAGSFEYLPWTASSHPNGVRDSLLHVINVIVKHGVRSSGEPELKQQHYKNLVELIDFYLDGRKAYLESIKELEKYDVLVRKYESERSDLIFNFVDDGQYELAAKLAEKYLDFKTLVVVCDQTKNQQRLEEYIERYKAQDFSQFAINWHLQQNKRGDLFERFKRNQEELTRFLGDHPSLGWIQAVFNGDMDRASRILLSLAQSESDLVLRKKTILSLAKLASLAADEDLTHQIELINDELSLIEHQLKIPVRLMNAFGYDAKNQMVLKPDEIINLFIADENVDATEEDFHRALSLAHLVDDQVEIKQKIWCAAILRDNWEMYNVNAPLEAVQSFTFYKLVDLCLILYVELDEILPPIQELLDAPDLAHIATSKSFQFLLKLTYEYFYDTFKKSE